MSVSKKCCNCHLGMFFDTKCDVCRDLLCAQCRTKSPRCDKCTVAMQSPIFAPPKPRCADCRVQVSLNDMHRCQGCNNLICTKCNNEAPRCSRCMDVIQGPSLKRQAPAPAPAPKQPKFAFQSLTTENPLLALPDGGCAPNAIENQAKLILHCIEREIKEGCESNHGYHKVVIRLNSPLFPENINIIANKNYILFKDKDGYTNIEWKCTWETTCETCENRKRIQYEQSLPASVSSSSSASLGSPVPSGP